MRRAVRRQPFVDENPLASKMSPSFGSGLKSCQMISSPYISTPSSFHNCEMSPFGSGGPPPPNMPIMPPGGRFGCAVPTTSPRCGHGIRILENGRRLPAFTAATKLSIASGDERRRLHGQQHIVLVLDRLRWIDLHHVVLLLQLGDELRLLGRSLHREAAEELDIGLQHAQLLALLLGDRANRSHQLVFDRNALVDERNHDAVQART